MHYGCSISSWTHGLKYGSLFFGVHACTVHLKGLVSSKTQKVLMNSPLRSLLHSKMDYNIKKRHLA